MNAEPNVVAEDLESAGPVFHFCNILMLIFKIQ